MKNEISNTFCYNAIFLVFLTAQEINQRRILLGFSAGPSFANLLQSEAPHKINIYGSNNENLKEKEFTNKIDYGLTFGGGLSKRLCPHLLLIGEIKLDIGFRKVDAKYNNKYKEEKVASGSNLSNTILTSTNYHGFNSNSKNISTAILVGINYII